MAEPRALSAAGEDAWQTLRQHAEWSSGFWLAWIFTDHPPTAEELRRRLAGQRVQPMVVLDISTPTDLEAVMGALLEGPTPTGHAWVRAGNSDEEARRAWEVLHLRLNEQRERLRARLPHGLVLVGPVAWKAVTSHAAPDLWSIRSLALEPGGIPGERRGTPARSGLERPVEPVDAELAERGLRRAQAVRDREAEAVARTRLARARLQQGRPGEARELAVLAAEGAPPGMVRARALGALAEAEQALGDGVAATEHFGQAVREAGGNTSSEVLWWGLEQGWLLLAASRLDEALVVAEALVDKARSNAAEDLAPLTVALHLLGDTQRELSRTEEARLAYELSVELGRQALDARGERPSVLRDLASSLDRLGKVAIDLGDLGQARRAASESVRLSRRVRDLLGDNPSVLRELSLHLDDLGRIERDLGHPEEARAACAESLELTRRVREQVGDTPEVLVDLSAGLIHLGRLEDAQGQVEQALVAYREALALCRRVRGMVGDHPGVLRNLATSLDGVGVCERNLRRPVQARAAFAESLELCRQLRAALGDQPHLLRDLAMSAFNLASTTTGSERADLAAECLAAAEALATAAPLPANRELVAWARDLVGEEPGKG